MSTLRELIAQHQLVAAGDPNLGPFDDLPLPDEEMAAMRARADQWCSSLKPANAIEMWLLEQVAVQALRLERCQVDEAARRDALARRAVESWDEDRRRDVEDLAAKLPRSPALVARHLRGSRAGAAWLLARWATLRGRLESGAPWTSAERSHALDLLGTPAPDRPGPAAVDLPAADLLAFVATEVDRLQALHDGPLADLDRRDRASAARGLGPAIDAALAPLRRLERSVARRMEWLLMRFQAGRRLTPPAPWTDPGDRPASADPRSRDVDDVDPRTIPPPARKRYRRARGSTPPGPPPLDPRRPLLASALVPAPRVHGPLTTPPALPGASASGLAKLNPRPREFSGGGFPPAREATLPPPPRRGGRRPGEQARSRALERLAQIDPLAPPPWPSADGGVAGKPRRARSSAPPSPGRGCSVPGPS